MGEKRTLLLCFIHGFKGSDDTFQSFPWDLKKLVSDKLPEHNVESVVYPKYETKGELGKSWKTNSGHRLKERVMEVRKAHVENPWPPTDREVGVILVAHSMGGFVAVDALFSILNDRITNGEDESTPIFPLIQGILTFDTPFNGLARSMFVYGTFSNYQKVSSVFNVMTALSAAAPSAIGKMALGRSAATRSVPAAAGRSSSSPAWKSWQLIAVRTGTVGAIAAGGVAAYVHRQQILDGVKNVRNINVREGYQQGVDALGQGLAYINRGNVGRSLAYLSDHLTFVGALMKQQELGRRLERMGALRGGVGIRDVYASLGENGVWSGGYFVPERTFCAVPPEGHPAGALFSRRVVRGTEDEVQAHVGMFKRDSNPDYDEMAEQAADDVVAWFADESPIVDDPKLATEPPAPEPIEEPVATTEDGTEVPKPELIAAAATGAGTGGESAGSQLETDDNSLPDESPLDIAAAASLVPLPDDENDDAAEAAAVPDGSDPEAAKKSTYIRYLFSVAQQAGTDIKSYVPRTMPDMPQMPSGPSSFKSYIPSQMPSMPNMPNMPNMPKLPSMSMFPSSTKKAGATATTGAGESETSASKPSEAGEEVPEGGKEPSVDESNQAQAAPAAAEIAQQS
ncbi:hypothetical protein BX600DRAFT_502592 [Xylariales sp. PMI_506]|nr:hypothetical protein BX600DRAFT_502592 [Xylariales sp. PMI_506]